MKVLIALICLIVANVAFADDAPRIAERVSCADIKTRITELSAIEEATDDELAELEQLKTDYRSKCSRSAAKRKSSAAKNDVVAPTVVTAEISEEEVAEQPSEITVAQETAAEVVTEDKKVIEEVAVEIDEEALLEQELANLDAGLCADGTKPNKFGCCAGEVFKDLGKSVFACCPETGDGECFPPIQ